MKKSSEGSFGFTVGWTSNICIYKYNIFTILLQQIIRHDDTKSEHEPPNVMLNHLNLKNNKTHSSYESLPLQMFPFSLS